MKFCWTTIHVNDMKKSLDFYQNVLNLEINRRIKPNDDREIVFLGSSETQVELIQDAGFADISFGKDISLGFVVPSIEQFMKTLDEKKIPLESGPFQPNPSIRFIYILDPDGLKIQLVEHLA